MSFRPMVAMLALLLFFCHSSVTASSNTVQSPVLSFGVVPQQAASKLARLWTPILYYLSKETGVILQFKTAPNIPEFEKRLAAGEYDLAYMNPYHYTTFHKSPGYVAFAKQKNKQIKGIIVVAKNSPIKNVDELNHQTLAFPSPAAFAASVLPQAHFKQSGITITAKYVSSHDSVYRAVAQGITPAGGGIMRTFNNLKPEIQGKLRVLWNTKQFTPHALAAHPRVDARLLQNIQTAMVLMHENETGLKLLSAIKFEGIDKAEDHEWDDVRALQIDLLEDLVKP
ncbi:phosphate/phosphite/phosphonate ABC transporter substrate-binding protein [Kaarinaea lacus]